eukprot:1675043-Pyramimonas_sp.AAC.1
MVTSPLTSLSASPPSVGLAREGGVVPCSGAANRVCGGVPFAFKTGLSFAPPLGPVLVCTVG